MLFQKSRLMIGTLSLTAGLHLVACDGGNFEVPIPLVSPPLPLDISGQVDAAAASLCADTTEIQDGVSMGQMIQELLKDGTTCDDYQGLKDELPPPSLLSWTSPLIPPLSSMFWSNQLDERF